jgi:class 3 adenylate cyclase
VAGSTSAGTKGFLFCDLRGYTAFIERNGDAAAAELLAVYRTLVRGVIAAHEGAEIRTEGDSFYVVFGAASGAVEAGLGIVAGAAEASTKEQPIAVGVGIHAGETVATTEGLVGGAVNIAARVCAKAQAGEVLVTDTVRALTRTFLPYTYTSLGTQSLKGIAGGIPLYRVEAVPSSGRARLRRQLGARRGRLVLLTGLVVLLAVGAAGAWAVNRPADCLTLPASTKDVVVRIDPDRGCVVQTIAVGQRPGPIVAAGPIVWVANVDDQTLTWIDPTSHAFGATSAGGPPIALAAGPDGVVVLDRTARLGTGINGGLAANDQLAVVTNRLRRMAGIPSRLPDPRAGLVSQSFSGYQGLTTVAQRALVSNSVSGQVVQVPLDGVGYTTIDIEPPDLRPLSPGTGLGPIASGGGTVWLANTERPILYRLEGTGRPTLLTIDGDSGTVAIDVTDDAIWLARGDGRLTRVPASTGSPTTFDVGAMATAIAADRDTVWATDLLGARVIRVDAATGDVTARIPVGGRPAGVAIGPDGSVWVTLQGP